MTRNKNKIYRIIFLLIGLFLFIFPLLTLFLKAFELESGGWGMNNFIRIFDSKRTMQAISNTVYISVLSTLISVFLGMGMAVLIAYTNIKYKKALELLTILPYVIPGYIITLAWTSLFANNSPVNTLIESVGLPKVDMYSYGGIIFVLGISNAALVYLNLVESLRKIQIEQGWASNVSGYGAWATLKNINLRSVLPSIVNGVLLSFLSAIDNFAVVSTLGTPAGINVLSTYIYEKAIGFGPASMSEAAVLSIFLAVIAFIAIFIQIWVLRKSVVSEQDRPNFQPRILFEKSKRRIIGWLVFLVLLVINVLPLITMFFSSLQVGYSRSIFDVSNMGIDNYTFIFRTPSMYQGFFTSLGLTVSAIVICVIFSVWVAYYNSRYDRNATRPVELGASLTYSTPGIVLALCMILYWTNVPNVYGTMKILLIAYVTRYLLIILNGSKTAISEVNIELEEASQISGASGFQKWHKIIIPLISNQILSSSFLMFTSAFTELTLSALLVAANSKTVGLTIFNLQTGGDNNVAQAYSVLVVIFILGIVGFRNHFERKELNQ